MVPVSVVIIAQNKNEIIPGCIDMIRLITDDIVIVDNQLDNGVDNPSSTGCRVYHQQWDNYASNKNKGISLAKYNWILSIDSDEIPDIRLVRALHGLKLTDPEMVYDIKFKSYFGKKLIRFGKWGGDHHVRLFNRDVITWSESPVHETLTLIAGTQIQPLNGYIHHYSVRDAAECRSKAIKYAVLGAQKCYLLGKKATLLKRYGSPAFNFIKNYLLYLGFLDGTEGWTIAVASVNQTWIKYHLLNQMEVNDKFKPIYADKSLMMKLQPVPTNSYDNG